MDTLAVYMLVEDEEEGGMRTRKWCSRCRVLSQGGSMGLGRRLQGPGTPTGKGKTSIELLKSRCSMPIQQPSMAHTPRPRPTASHTRTPTTNSPTIRTLHGSSHPTDAYVYVGWDGAFCVWGEGERIAVPLVYQSQHRHWRKIEYQASTPP